MPRLRVPLQPRNVCGDSSSCHDNSKVGDEISISYTVRGRGPVLVVMIPGALVPATMYDSLANKVAADGRYTAVTIDNRGIGRSDTPPVANTFADVFRGRLNYSPSILANDAWTVVDCVRRTRKHRVPGSSESSVEFLPEIALVGHSMGGMVVQRMIMQRPTQVRFAALLSTHAGGLWNFVPTVTLFLAALRLVVNRFDSEVSAIVHLDLHFTGSFLDQLIEPASHFVPRLRSLSSSSLSPSLSTLEVVANRVSPPWSSDAIIQGTDIRGTQRTKTDRDWAHQVELRRKRRDVYFARYIGRDFDWLSGLPGDPRHVPVCDSSDDEQIDIVASHDTISSSDPSDTPSNRLSSSQKHPGRKRPPRHLEPTKVGHLLVAIQHRLWPSEAARLSSCRRLQTLVIAGSCDQVTTSLASRTLARHTESVAYVELQGAHFIFDEQAWQVSTFLCTALADACFTTTRVGGTSLSHSSSRQMVKVSCSCQWCGESVNATISSIQDQSAPLGLLSQAYVFALSWPRDMLRLIRSYLPGRMKQFANP